MTFNIGDKVILKEKEELESCPYIVQKMLEHAGQTVTIIGTHYEDYIIAEDKGEISCQDGHFYWNPKCFVGLAPKEESYSGEWFWYEAARCPVWSFACKTYKDRENSYCCILPEANYHDATYGLDPYTKVSNYHIPENQAYFIGGDKLKPITWRVVDRKPKVGDCIRLKEQCYTFDKKGQILIVSEVADQHVRIQTKDYYTTKAFKEGVNQSDYLWSYNKDAYEVVEPCTGREGLIKPELWVKCIDITTGEIRAVNLQYYTAHKSILRPLIREE